METTSVAPRHASLFYCCLAFTCFTFTYSYFAVAHLAVTPTSFHVSHRCFYIRPTSATSTSFLINYLRCTTVKIFLSFIYSVKPVFIPSTFETIYCNNSFCLKKNFILSLFFFSCFVFCRKILYDIVILKPLFPDSLNDYGEYDEVDEQSFSQVRKPFSVIF